MRRAKASAILVGEHGPQRVFEHVCLQDTIPTRRLAAHIGAPAVQLAGRVHLDTIGGAYQAC